MSAAIRTQIIKIGNSQGVRIPKLLLEQSGIHSEVEIELQGDYLTIRKASSLRVGWEQAFAAMAEKHEDILLDEDDASNWDQIEWQW